MAEISFEYKRKSLIEYMRVKIDEGDWHGVSDAANDLRVLEAGHAREIKIKSVEISDEIKEKLRVSEADFLRTVR